MSDKLNKSKQPILIEVIDVSNNVYCDYCNKDYTDKDDSGDILFGSNAICPDYTPNALKNIEKHNEESHIKARCPKDMSYANWVRNHLR